MPAWRVMVQYSGIGGVSTGFHGVLVGFAADGTFMWVHVWWWGWGPGRRDPA